MNRSDDVHHLAAAYALDALDPGERVAFEQHYPGCDVCRADTVAFREALGGLAASAGVTPSAGVRDGVMASIAQTRQLSPRVAPVVDLDRRRRRRIATASALAAASVALVVAAVLVLGASRTSFSDDVAAVLDRPDATLLVLEGSVSGDVRVAWSQSAGTGVLIADGLSPAPVDRAYELWLITETGAVPMQVLDDAGDDGSIRATFEVDEPPLAWGVTVEPAAGSAAPTTDILFVAEV